MSAALSRLLPGDKSLSHRALLLSALAEGESRIVGLCDGEDVKSTARCLSALGVGLREDGASLLVAPPRDGLVPPAEPLHCGNAGTLARLLAGLLAGRAIRAALVGDASLSRRPMDRVAEPLAALFGAPVLYTTRGTLPAKVVPAPLPRGDRRLSLVLPSAQVKSAVLLAALRLEGTLFLEEAAPTRDHTERLLCALSASLEVAAPGVLRLRGPVPPWPGASFEIPKDPSAAAFLCALAAGSARAPA